MKRTVLSMVMTLIVLMGCPMGMEAQSVVKGCLLDSLTQVGEPFATIRVYRGHVAVDNQIAETHKPVAMSVTDMEGCFQQEVSGRGEYQMLFSSVGKANLIVDLTLRGGHEVIDLGTLLMQDDTQMLGVVEVVAQRPLVKMEVDKMTYNTEDDVDAASSTVLDMLRKVPMVTVDGQDNITVNGSSSFQVYVDGKPNVMISSNPSMILKNMPASMVKNIEVITNPGVRYDAEGVGGVLNLVMQKSGGNSSSQAVADGFNATVRGTYSARGYMGGGYLSVQKGKFSMSLNANAMKTKMDDMQTDVEREQQESSSTSNYLTSSSLGDTDATILMGNLSMGYELDTLNTFSATLGWMGLSTKSDMDNTTSLWGGSYGSGFGYTGQTLSDADNYSVNGSLDYQHIFRRNPGRILTLSYLLTTSPKSTESYSLFDDESSYLDLTDRFTDAESNTVENTLQVDYTTPLATNHTLSVGAKYINRNNHSDSDYYLDEDGTYVYSTDGSLNYKHRNHILAGYAEYDGHLGRWGLKGGVRYEHTWQKVTYATGQGENFSLDYGNLVPSANLSYQISQSQNIGLTYNMRISRPGITYLNPYVDQSDPTSLSYGNTDLECEKAHNISLVYNYFSSRWIVNLTLRQSMTDNAIESYSFYEGTVMNTTYGNIVKNHQTGLNAYINWNATPLTRIYMNGGVTYSDLSSSTLDTSHTGWKANLMLGAQQTLPWKIRMSLNIMASTKSQTLQGSSGGYNTGMLTLSRPFLKGDRLNVSVMGVTPLSGKDIKIKSRSAGSDFVSTTRLRIPMQTVSISLSYSFGRQHTVKKTKKTIQNTDVKEVESQTGGFNKMILN